MRMSKWPLPTLCLIAPAIVYVLVITRGTGDLFGPDELWKAYNQYTLSLLRGSLTVSAEAIRAEGLYIDGKVYMYYGLLPALLRIPLVPFVDLNLVPIARVIVLLQMLVAAGATQFILAKLYLRGSPGAIESIAFVVVSFTAWFASGPWFLVQGAPIYNEPFASGLMLVCVFAVMAFWDLEFRKAMPGPGRLLVYALLAALCIHARQTMAVSLIAAALLLILWPRAGERGRSWVIGAALRGVLPLLLIGVSGVLYLWLNHVRFGNAGAGWQIDGYGYYLINGETERFRAFRELGQFEVARMLPNLIVMMIGGETLHRAMIDELGLIMVRVERPLPRLLLAWAVGLGLAAWGLRSLFGRGLRFALGRPPLWLALCFLLTALLQLAYATVTFRYHVELWPVALWLLFYGYSALPLDRMQQAFRATARALALMLVLSATSAVVVAQSYLPPRLRWQPLSPDNYANPVHPALLSASQSEGARPSR